MSNEILVDIEEIQSLLNKMITCKDKASVAGAKAKKSIKGFCDEGVSSASSAYRAIKKADEALIQSIDSGISALNKTIIQFKEADESIAKSSEKIPVSKIVVPSTPTKTSTTTGNSNSTGSVNSRGESYGEIQNVLKTVDGVRQVHKVVSGKNNDIGRCETVSLATLINRKIVLDGKDPQSLGYSLSETDYVNREGFYTGNNEKVKDTRIPQAMNTLLEQNGDGTPKANSVYAGYTLKESSARSETEIVSLLQTHPEGIQIAVKANGMQHKIVISDYTVKEDGSYQFYCYDGVNGNYDSHPQSGRIELEKAWTWTDKNTGWATTGTGTAAFFAALEYVRYLE